MAEGREATHQAEPWRRGYEPNVVFGWHCLTCSVEVEDLTQEQAEQAAEQHQAGGDTTPDDPRVLSQEDGPYYAAPHRYSHAGHGRWWCPDCSVWIRNADCPRNQKWLADMAVLNG